MMLDRRRFLGLLSSLPVAAVFARWAGPVEAASVEPVPDVPVKTHHNVWDDDGPYDVKVAYVEQFGRDAARTIDELVIKQFAAGIEKLAREKVRSLNG